MITEKMIQSLIGEKVHVRISSDRNGFIYDNLMGELEICSNNIELMVRGPISIIFTPEKIQSIYIEDKIVLTLEK